MRPSVWSNPFLWITESEEEAVALFRAYAEVRMDKYEWLSPLFGKLLYATLELRAHTLVCLWP